METVYTWGLNRDSCPEALIARRRFDIDYPGAGQRRWYEWGCKRGDWLIWQLMQIELSDELKQALQRALIKIADRAVRNYALNSPKASIRKWAEDWLSGKDRSYKSALAASAAASEAAEAAASAVASSVALASSALRAAASEAAEAAASSVASSVALALAASSEAAIAAAAAAARKKELKLQAEDIRSEIPEWPGG